MQVQEIAFCAYPVTDLKRARNFYGSLLGLKESRFFGDDNGAWVEFDIGTTSLAICNMVPDWKASAGGGSVAVEVDKFDEAIQQLKAAGVPFVNGPFETPVCHMATVSDPDGNSVIIHKRKG